MIRIVDTTLRDGEQKAGIALCMQDKVEIAKLLSRAGIYQIEAGIPAMGGDEKNSIRKIASLGLKSKISTWNRMNIADITHSIECFPDIIHISVPASDIQIKSKLGKDRRWVVDNLKRCICFALESGCETIIGIEDASRADLGFILDIIFAACYEGVKRIRYADTVGICYREKVYKDIKALKSVFDIGIEFHAHNDLGMAVSNSIAAYRAGADYIDCTIGGIGERAGNCDYHEFVRSAKACLGELDYVTLTDVINIQNSIMSMIYTRAVS